MHAADTSGSSFLAGIIVFTMLLAVGCVSDVIFHSLSEPKEQGAVNRAHRDSYSPFERALRFLPHGPSITTLTSFRR